MGKLALLLLLWFCGNHGWWCRVWCQSLTKPIILHHQIPFFHRFYQSCSMQFCWSAASCLGIIRLWTLAKPSWEGWVIKGRSYKCWVGITKPPGAQFSVQSSKRELTSITLYHTWSDNWSISSYSSENWTLRTGYIFF